MSDLDWQAGIVIASCIGILLWAFYSRTKAWSHPAVVFAFFWFAMTLLPLISTPHLSLSFYGFGYIALAVAAFGAPAVISSPAQPVGVRASGLSPASQFGGAGILVTFFMLQTVPILCVVLNLPSQGFPLSSLADPIRLNCEYLAARYNGHTTSNYFTTIGLLANYVGAPIGGMIAANRKGFALPFAILIATFLPGTVNMIAYADKGTVFLTAAYFYGGVIVGRVARGDTALITLRTFVGAFAIGALLTPLVVMAMLNRPLQQKDCAIENRSANILSQAASILTFRPQSLPPPKISKEELKGAPEPHNHANVSGKLSFLLRSYAVGSQFAFSRWFDSYFFEHGDGFKNPASLTWGRYTFLAMAKALDPAWAKQLPEGYYGEYFKAGDALQSNIYTFWRGLIVDFGLIGSLIIMMLAGTVANFCYKRMLFAKRPVLSQAFYTSFIAFTYYTSLISLFTWSTPVAAPIGVVCILLATQIFSSGREPKFAQTAAYKLKVSDEPKGN